MLNVFYRITDIPSTNPSPWRQDNKRELNRVCLKSFIEAFRDINPEIFFIADHCDRSLNKMLKMVPFNYEVEYTELGINGTMLKSYELASKEKDFVLFQECDYLYRPDIGKNYLRALKELDIVSPYDHRNFYIDRSIHSPTCDVQVISDHHFRSTERNTMTWATHSDIVRENLGVLTKYGYLDDEVWKELLIAGHQLWVPIPSFATHCVKGYLSPAVSWGNLWLHYQSQS